MQSTIRKWINNKKKRRYAHGGATRAEQCGVKSMNNTNSYHLRIQLRSEIIDISHPVAIVKRSMSIKSNVSDIIISGSILTYEL